MKNTSTKQRLFSCLFHAVLDARKINHLIQIMYQGNTLHIKMIPICSLPIEVCFMRLLLLCSPIQSRYSCTFSEIYCLQIIQPGSKPHVFPSPTFFFFFGLFRTAPAAYGGAQARGHIGAVAASLHHSHSNVGS